MPDTTLPLDGLCADAVALAHEAALEVGGHEVGEHVEVTADGELVATHHFACLSRGYRGWRWAVTVARAAGSDVVTVDEVVLLPGEEAVLPKAWVPYAERLQPGDLGPGDLLPHMPDDLRLVPAYTEVDALDTPVVEELGLGRERVLSAYGRDEAAERWYDGDHGPHTPIAKQAPGPCATCGFYYRLSGALGTVFGACTNAFAPDDGRVVSVDHGCGAHSEAVPDIPLLPEPLPVILDDLAIDLVERSGASSGTDAATEPAGTSAPAVDAPAGEVAGEPAVDDDQFIDAPAGEVAGEPAGADGVDTPRDDAPGDDAPGDDTPRDDAPGDGAAGDDVSDSRG
jgi:hypothetical protein